MGCRGVRCDMASAAWVNWSLDSRALVACVFALGKKISRRVNVQTLLKSRVKLLVARRFGVPFVVFVPFSTLRRSFFSSLFPVCHAFMSL